MRLSSAFTQKGTDKNVEEVVILKAGIICVKSSDSRVFPYAKLVTMLFEKFNTQ